ncbi:MAG: 50S ribosomal protein L3 N(5)-glutamine methyltransferase [Gammaproteobacteria bacterium]|nr:50S ribosomal protein L3 N(5)-glutamine methyltransferase [Gammaproteobacteria bacterium]
MRQIDNSKAFDDAARDLFTLRDFMRWAMSAFARYKVHFGHGTDNALDEAAYLILQALDLPPDLSGEWLDTHLTHAERIRLAELLRQRCIERIPTAYLVGKAWFAGLEFIIDRRALIPRSPLGELIQQGFSPWVEADRIHTILDLCTGSGCIALACAHYLPHTKVDAIDLSFDALELARLNREKLGLEKQVELLEGDLFAPVAGRRYDLIVSNPPYVDAHDMAELPPEYRHEPRMALEAGEDGLNIVRRILREAPQHLEPEGVLIVEVGNSQEHVEHTWPDVPFTWLSFEHGEDGVFLLTREELVEHAGHFGS